MSIELCSSSGSFAVGDVREDPSFRGLPDERAVLHVEQGDDGARRLLHERVDRQQRLGPGVVTDDHDRDIGSSLDRRLPDLSAARSCGR